ncbi:hypothetical protein VNO78_08588 [Psophocarpus tetragonolobus]|uniref:Uncharacterized protein n=1 Tax=Psophocarpus tetragonolobus TaxID=3891 RepID=A0AAN9SWN0_PSOTE
MKVERTVHNPTGKQTDSGEETEDDYVLWLYMYNCNFTLLFNELQLPFVPFPQNVFLQWILPFGPSNNSLDD